MRKQVLLLTLLSAVAVVDLGAQNDGYVVDNANGQVLVIDLSTRSVKAIPACVSASELLILPNNRYALVSCPDAGELALLDLESNQRITAIPARQGPGSLTATPDGRYVYVANDASNDVSVIDMVGGLQIQPIAVGATPVQVNVSPDGRFVYAVNKDETPAGTVSVIDTLRNKVIKTLTVGMSPNQFAILPNLGTAYVVNTGSNDVSVVDLGTNEVTGTIPVGQAPVSVAYSSDSHFLYVVNRGSGSVSVVDTQQNGVVGTIPTGAQPAAMVVTFDPKFGFVSNSGSDSVSLLDLRARTLELNIPVGTSPFSLMLDPDENFLYVTNTGSGSLSVIDVNADRVAGTVALGGVPVQFTMLNAPTLLELAPNPAVSGTALVLSGEGFRPSSAVRLTMVNPLRTLMPQTTFLDSQGLQIVVPDLGGASAVVDVLQADGNSSERITLPPGTATSRINAGGVVEAAGFTLAPAPISGNGIVAVFGTFPGMPGQVAPDGVFPLPLSLGDTRVTFNGIPAPLFATINAPGYSQINLVAPVRILARDKVRVAVTAAGQTSAAETVNVARSSPGIFTDSTSGAAIAVHGGGNQSLLVTPANPARRGERLVLYVAGVGDTMPPPREGEPAPLDVLSNATLPVSVSVGGVAAESPAFAGLTPSTSGLYQVNFDVPQTAPTGNDVEVWVTMDTRTSNKAKLAVQ